MIKIPVYLRDMYDAKHLVQAASGCEKNVDLICGRYIVDAKSMLGVFSLPTFDDVELGAEEEDEEKLRENTGEFKAASENKNGGKNHAVKSQEMRKLAPELDPLRIGTG